MLNIEELKAKVEQAKAKNHDLVREHAEIARLEATLKLENSPELFQAKVRLAASEQQTNKLRQLVEECAAIIASTPIHDAKTRQNKVWRGSRKINYGSQVDLMYQLATGILYACQEHKQLLLAHTGLTVELCDEVVKAFGKPTYYNRNYHTVVEAKPYNVDMVKSTIQVMQSELDVVIDTSALTENNLNNEFISSEVSAMNDYKAAKEAIAEADFTL